MKRSLAILLCAIGAVTFSLDAASRGPGGGGGGFGSSAGSFSGGAGRGVSNAPPADVRGYSNSNAPFTGDENKGLDRAQERMSDEGLSHEKATANQNRRKEVPPPNPSREIGTEVR